MTDEELKAIEQRAATAKNGQSGICDHGREQLTGDPWCETCAELVGKTLEIDVPALIAEVRRLRAELEKRLGFFVDARRGNWP